MKINCDVASKGNAGPIACGWIMREASGSWLLGYICKLGVCDSFSTGM